jgi:hypothetical protein
VVNQEKSLNKRTITILVVASVAIIISVIYMIHNSATVLATPSITKDSNLKVDPNYIVVAAPDLRGVRDSSKPPTGYDGKTVALYTIHKSYLRQGHNLVLPIFTLF